MVDFRNAVVVNLRVATCLFMTSSIVDGPQYFSPIVWYDYKPPPDSSSISIIHITTLFSCRERLDYSSSLSETLDYSNHDDNEQGFLRRCTFSFTSFLLYATTVASSSQSHLFRWYIWIWSINSPVTPYGRDGRYAGPCFFTNISQSPGRI
jgi:hypothetical protein